MSLRRRYKVDFSITGKDLFYVEAESRDDVEKAVPDMIERLLTEPDQYEDMIGHPKFTIEKRVIEVIPSTSDGEPLGHSG